MSDLSQPHEGLPLTIERAKELINVAITAAHVVRRFEEARSAATATSPLHLQIMNSALKIELIDISGDLDLTACWTNNALVTVLP